MTPEPQLAWLIHKTLTGDTSLRLRFFTREKGMLDCYYRGGRKTKNGISLQPFIPLCLLTNERHHWFYVKSIESADLPLNLSGPALFSALYINELLFYTVTLQEQDEPLFLAYQNTLKNLETSQHPLAIESSLRRFEKALLTACGYSLTLTTEDNLSELIKPSAYYQLIPEHGFKEVNTGIPGHHILALAADQLDDPLVLKSAKRIMRQAIDHLLGGRALKSRSLYLPKSKA